MEQTPADIHIAIPAAAAHPAWHVAYVAGPHSTIPIKKALVMTARARVTLLLNMVMLGRIIEFLQLEWGGGFTLMRSNSVLDGSVWFVKISDFRGEVIQM